MKTIQKIITHDGAEHRTVRSAQDHLERIIDTETTKMANDLVHLTKFVQIRDYLTHPDTLVRMRIILDATADMNTEEPDNE